MAHRPLIAALALAALAITGCNSPSSAPTDTPSKTPGTTASTGAPKDVKIAFLVKQPEEKWFQTEWKFAGDAAKEKNFQLITLGIPDGGDVLPKLENVAAQGVQGVIICSPDVKLGDPIIAKCKERNMKVMSVDDQLLDKDGKPEDIPHLGISASKIGNNVGTALSDEMTKRKWDPKDTGFLVITHDETPTIKDRTDGAIEGLKGFPADHVFKAAQKTLDVPGGRDAASPMLTQHPEIKHWLIAGGNDTAVMGAVRATEAKGITADNVIGIGINGDSALDDLKKDKATGMFGSILLQAKRHGHDTAVAMYDWIASNKEPEKITYTDGILITRDNYKQVLADQGLPLP